MSRNPHVIVQDGRGRAGSLKGDVRKGGCGDIQWKGVHANTRRITGIRVHPPASQSAGYRSPRPV